MKLTSFGETVMATGPQILNHPTIPPEDLTPYARVTPRETRVEREQRLLPQRIARRDAALARIAAYNPEPRIADNRLKVRRANVEKDIDATRQYQRDQATVARMNRLIESTRAHPDHRTNREDT